MEKWTFVLSVIGAAAWFPIVFSPIVNHFRRIHANLFEFKVLTQGMGRSIGSTTYKKGIIVLMVVNMFIKNTDYYPVTVRAKVKLINGTDYSAELLDYYSITSVDDGIPKHFNIPLDMEFNIARTIRKNTDNIKYVALLIEGLDELELKDIEEIVMVFNTCTINKKVVKITHSQFPSFNGTELLETQKNNLNEKQNFELFDYLDRTSKLEPQGKSSK